MKLKDPAGAPTPTRTNPSSIPPFVGLLVVALIVGTFTVLAWPKLAKSIGWSPNPSPTLSVIRIGIPRRPAYALAVYLNRGLKHNHDSDFRKRRRHLNVDFVLVDEDENNPIDRLGGAGAYDVDLLWSTVDSLPSVLKKYQDVRVIMKVATSVGSDDVVFGSDFNITSLMHDGSSIAVPQHGPGNWILHQRLAEPSAIPHDPEHCIWCRHRRSVAGSSQARKLLDSDNTVKAAVISGWELNDWQASAGGQEQFRTTVPPIVDVMVAKGNFIAQHREDLKELISIWLSGSEKSCADVANYFRDHEPFRADLTKGQHVLDKVRWASVGDNETFFCDGWEENPFRAQLGTVSRFWNNHEMQTGKLESGATLDLSLLPLSTPPPPSGDASSESLCGLCAGRVVVPPLRIYFRLSSTVLSVAERRNIDEKLRHVRPRTKCFDVFGYADAAGESTLNRALSLRRAQEVATYLARLGVPTERICASGEGQLGDRTDSEGVRASNRRVEIRARQDATTQ